MRLFEKTAAAIELINEWCGKFGALMVVLLVVITVYDVVMRYVFSSGSVAIQELEWHLFGMIILIGAGYTLKHRDHVRVDVIYASSYVSDRTRHIIDILGNLIFLIPFCAVLIYSSIPFVESAFIQLEHSPDPGGLPHRWLLKACIPFGCFLLLLQGIADTIRGIKRLRADIS